MLMVVAASRLCFHTHASSSSPSFLFAATPGFFTFTFDDKDAEPVRLWASFWRLRSTTGPALHFNHRPQMVVARYTFE